MRYSTKQKMTGLLFVSPWIIGFIVFTLVPFFQTMQYSVSEVRFLTQGITLTPVGFDNFVQVLFVNPDFKLKLLEYLKQIFLFVPMVIVFSIMLAVLLNTKLKGRRFFRAVYFLPVILISGPVLENLNKMGATKLDGLEKFFVYEFIAEFFPGFLSSPLLFIFDNVVLFLWFSGVQILILLSGLQKNDKSMYEALSIDGATAWQQFWKVTLPILKPFIFLNTVYTIVDLSVSDNNPLIGMIKKGMFDGKMGFGFSAAATWIYFLIIVMAVLLAYLLLGRGEKAPKDRKNNPGRRKKA